MCVNNNRRKSRRKKNTNTHPLLPIHSKRINTTIINLPAKQILLAPMHINITHKGSNDKEKRKKQSNYK